MKNEIRQRGGRTSFLGWVLAILLVTGGGVSADTYYWDINGTEDGAGGASPGGTWDGGSASATNWNTDADGGAGSFTNATTTNDDLVLSAGTDAAGAYALSVVSTQSAKSLTFEDGAATLNGGTLNLAAAATLAVNGGLTGSIASVVVGTGIQVTKTGAGTLVFAAVSNRCTGSLTVDDGMLLLNGGVNANNNSSVTVNAGATLRYGVPDQIVAAKVTLNGGAFDLGTNRDHIGTLTLSNGGQVRTAGINANHHLYVFGATGQIYAAGASNVIGSDIAMTSFYGGNPGNRTQNIDVGEGGTLDLTGRLRDAPPYGIAYIGSLRKTGSGLLTLSATNGYSGATTINGGTLSVNGLTPGLVTVQNAATLGGSGRVGSVIVESGGRVAPGTSIGALTASNVTWNAGTAWLFELGATNQGDRLECLGSFLQGSGSEFHFDFQGTGAAGVYTLVTWAASSDFDGGSFFADNPAAGLTPVFAIDANALTLTLTGSGGGGSSESTNASIRVSGGQVTVGISIASGALYRVQGNANLLNGAGWTNLTGQLTNQSVGNAVFSDPESAVLPARSYRVISP
jgi:autotransporter-associated beta strand protein